MSRFTIIIHFLLATSISSLFCRAIQVAPCESNIYCYGRLLETIQTARIFNDSKEFVDMPMKMDPDSVLSEFNKFMEDNNNSPNRDQVKGFLDRHFSPAGHELEEWKPSDRQETPEFLGKISDTRLRRWGSDLNKEWEKLGRKVKEETMANPNRTSLIPVPNPFIIPGGRFREYFYWDTYWIVDGLLVCGMTDTARMMIDNFVYLVNLYGFIPNGGRVYFLNRSQPPYLIPMAYRYWQSTGDDQYINQILPTLHAEYSWWDEQRTERLAHHQQGELIISRYNVNVTMPRPESWREDKHLVDEVGGGDRAEQLMRDIAAACESGWDFSSRWLQSTREDALLTSRTTDIYPVDLNSRLCGNARILSKLYNHTGDVDMADYYNTEWEGRNRAVKHFLWIEAEGIWKDHVISSATHVVGMYPSSLAPLYTQCVDEIQMVDVRQKVLNYIKTSGLLNYPGGIPTSLKESGEQWDLPNAWPPLQEVVVRALRTLQLDEADKLARDIAQKWVSSNYRGWEATGAMYEKYDANEEGGIPGGQGEYDVQDGFGWTNGVILKFLEMYGDVLTAPSSAATSYTTPSLILLLNAVILIPMLIEKHVT